MHRPAIPDQIVPILILADGFVSILLAVFAFTLGIDPNPDWGRSRIFIFFIGVVLICISLILYKQRPAFTRNETSKIIFSLSHVWAVIFVIYTWFITFGTFTEWRASTRYYTLLADAFSKGQLHVDVEPGAALLAATDPYNSESRPGFDDDVWDLSLYKGRLYLYWGPVPALLLTPAQLVLKTSFSDMYLVFFFLCGLLIVNTLIILKLWRLFFPNIRLRHVTLSIFVVGLILPPLWALSIPDVYEAAIGAGQFFLVGGIYFLILAFEKNIQKRYLFLAGLFWACSVGSRAINVLPILFLTALPLFWIVKNRPKDWMRLTASLVTPLALGAILIGWYNYARFDSPLEFGLRYQITIYNLNRDLPLAFQADYLPYNIAAYVFQPFEFISGFPFIQPVGFSELLQNRAVNEPKLYSAGHMTGMLFFAPFLLFSFVPFFKRKTVEAAEQIHFHLQKLTIYLLGGSFIISIASLLLYYYGQMRFLLDFISQITLLAILGYWMVIQNSKRSKLYLHLANILISITLIASLLLAVTSESGRMQKLNPLLIHKINTLIFMDQ